MSTTLPFNFKEINRLYEATSAKSGCYISEPNRYNQTYQKVQEINSLVVHKWDSLPERTKQMLTEFAYQVIEPPKPRFLKRSTAFLSRKVRVPLFILLTIFREDKRIERIEALTRKVYLGDRCLEALEELKNNILLAVERDNTNYQKELAGALESALSESGEGAMSSDEFGSWLARVSS